MKLVRFFILTTMLSAGARAFSSSVYRSRAGRPFLPYVRAMTTGEDSDISVVDICQQKIQDALEAQSVKVTASFDDPNGSHIQIVCVSSKFEGKRPVQRQQQVYKAIWEELQGPVHAVDSMICKTPEEAG